MDDITTLEILCKSPDLKFDILSDALWVSRNTEPPTPVIEALLRLKKADYKDLNKIQRKLSWTRKYIFRKLDGLCPTACYNLLFVASMSVPISESLIFTRFMETYRFSEITYPNLYKAVKLINKEEN
jgi:hypothetical protein